MTVYALSIHADYRCRHSGECCTADWDVPVEVPIYRSLSEALDAGRLRVAEDLPAKAGSYAGSHARSHAGSHAGSDAGSHAGSREAFVVESDLPDGAGAVLARTPSGDCVFFERGTHLCVVHRDLGEAALPSTCRHFPRLALRDARGTFLTLSHFCPTAASMLFRDDVPLEIVSSPAAFPPADYEGLVVRAEDWPPLLQPRRLTDLEGFAAWECHMVARCADLSRRPESVVATLARDARVLRRWQPGKQSLAEAVAALPPDVVDGTPHDSLDRSLALFVEAMNAVPADLKPEPDEHALVDVFATDVAPRWSAFHAPLNRYLGAKAFATWTSYQGRGVATIVRGLECALALVRVEAARQCRNAGRPLDGALLLEAFRLADFTLNHLATGDELARAWSAAENS